MINKIYTLKLFYSNCSIAPLKQWFPNFSKAVHSKSLKKKNSVHTRLLNKFPAKTVFTPMLAAMSKPKTLRGLQKNILGSSVGAASYMFASAANDFDGFAYEYDRFGNMTPKSTTDFIVDFIDETAKMSLLGSKSILHKNKPGF